MDAQTREHFKNLFLQMKKNHSLQEESLLEIFNKQDLKGDEVDKLLGEREGQLFLKLKSRQSFFLKKVDLALERIENKTFGECLSCGNDIEEKRLYARPTAVKCITCKEEEERNESHILYRKKSHTHGKEILNDNIVVFHRDESSNVIPLFNQA